MEENLERVSQFVKKYKIAVLSVIVAIVIAGVFYAILQSQEQSKSIPETPLVKKEQGEPTTVEKLFVDIKGEVNKPGVYQIEKNRIVNDVIALAGGLTEKADTSTVNLAAKVTNGQMIVVESVNNISTEASNVESKKVSLNRASIEELQTIPGVGISKAQAIIDFRKKNGSFSSIDDLDKISGFGLKTIEKIREFVSL